MSKKLALFFTSGVSLARWDRVGNLDREIKPYRKLIEEGHFDEVYFFTYGQNDKEEYEGDLPDGIKVFPNKYNLSNRVYTLLMPILYWRKFLGVNILKTNQMRGGWAAVIAKWLYWKPLVVRCGYEWYLFSQKREVSKLRLFLVKWLEWFVYKNADRIMISSHQAKDFIIDQFSLDGDIIQVLPNYIDTNLFTDEVGPEDPDKNKLCFVGKFKEQKNLLSLLDAIDGLDVKLDILGSGPLESKLKKKASNLDQATVEFKDNIPNDEVPKFLNNHSIFILPSHYEGNPKVILEAMSCGLACIGTDVDGTKEIVHHEENGLLCETDSESIRGAIERLLNNDDLRNRLGKNAREFIIDNFSLDRIVEIETEIYNQLG
ncbi:MAG: glycosyltransferase family 4 protein [Candidatus Paceibacteria bacterium]